MNNKQTHGLPAPKRGPNKMVDFDKVMGSFAKALKIDATEFLSALKDGDEWLPDEQIASKIEEVIVSEAKAARAEARNRAIFEAHQSVEKIVKSKGFTPEGNLKGTALLESFIEHLESKATDIDPEKTKTMTREELAAMPEVKRLMSEAVDKFGVEAKTKIEAVEKSFAEYKATNEAKKIETVAKQRLAAALRKGNVLLKPNGVEEISEEDRIENVWLDLRYRQQMRIGLDEKENPVFLNADGSILVEETLGKPILFDDVAVQRGLKLYGSKGPDHSKSGGDPKGNGAQPGGASKYQQEYFFKTPEEFAKAISNEPDPSKRAKMSEDNHFQQEKQKAAG